MTCRKCGTDIADKALVCYKCGTATTERVFAPPGEGRARSKATLVISLVALALMVLVAVFMTRASPDGTPRSVTWVFAGVAVVIIILRAYARRR